MADIQPSGNSSIAAPAAAAPIRDSSLEESGGGGGAGGGAEVLREGVSNAESATVHEHGDADATRLAGLDASKVSGHKREDVDVSAGDTAVQTSAPGSDMSSLSGRNPGNDFSDDATAASRGTTQLQPPLLVAHPSHDPGQTQTTTAQPQPQHPHPPLKRFTSVNINKKFLEKTSSTSGSPLGGSPLAGHASIGASTSGSAQRRGASPSSRSPSNDRPAPSRLVTAKLTAVPQPSAAATSGWLRPSSSTPGTSAASTPPSSSPQPGPSDASASYPQPTSSSGPQPLKRRPGESPVRNGAPSSGSTSSSAQQAGSKPVWGKVTPLAPQIGLGRGAVVKEIQNDFPTAAEAAHGRKTKVLNAQLAAETAAAQTAAQKQAMIETAAAFRGAHLDANARHWDEMEDDEDSDFLAGVIEFGDGTQYKIEHKADSAPSHDAPPSVPSDVLTPTSSKSLPFEPLRPITKEERFVEDFDRSWPRARTSPVQSMASASLPPRAAPPPHTGPQHSPTEGSHANLAQSPQDGTSPTSRVLFNERSNRLEPWSNAKPRLGPGQAPMARRDSREDHPPFGLLRQQPPPNLQGRDAPPHSHPPPNVQLLQKGPLSLDSAWKSGPPRGFGHGPERGRWGDGPRGGTSPSDERPWEARRRESMSSSDAHGSSVRDPSRDREGSRSRWDTGAGPHGRDVDHDRDRGRRNSNVSMPPPPTLPPSLARDRSRDAGRQLPPHLSRMPPPPVPPLRGALPGRDLPPHTTVPYARPSIVSPSTSVRSLLSPSPEQAPSISSVPEVATAFEEEVDKNALVKGAMQLALERAKKRKQEVEAEEKRRSEAAERARKKAGALAAAQEEKKKVESPPPARENVLERPHVQEAPRLSQLPAKPNGVEVATKSPDTVEPGAKDEPPPEAAPPKTVFGRPPAPPLRAVMPPPSLPRRPSIPTPSAHITAASQADSWRSKAAPVLSSPPRPPKSSALPPPPAGSLPPTTRLPELDLSVNPDENIEVVDFSDLGKLMGHPSSPEPTSTEQEPMPAPASSIRARRPIASDFFDDRPTSSREPLSPVKSDMPSWRRPPSKPMVISPPAAPGEELGTQTMPIFTADESIPVKDATFSTSEPKPPLSPTASPPFKRQSSQGEQIQTTSTTQSVYVPPAVFALRSPRTPSHFKEAPMSTLQDTMSRIKGALAGMQSQDAPIVVQSKELKESSPEHRASQPSIPAKAKVSETPTVLWREHRDSRSEVSSPVTRILAPPLVRPTPREVFDITRPDPPRSPKPAWNAFAVHLPKESRARDAVSRKQLHFWQLPHPGVRWDILSWDPPVEGMNKRELSRDEIFHRKNAIKGGKIRVLLPNKRVSPSRLVEQDLPRESASHPVLVTAAGVKIKLPFGTSSSRNAVEPLQPVPSARPRDTGVPSWRKSATPLTPLKKDRQSAVSVNGSPPDQELNTMSRSPPPEPSTPLPQFAMPKDRTSISPTSAHSATVSLPMNPPSKTSAPKRPAGPNVAFFRTSRGDAEAGNSKPLPRFTVTSELESGQPADTTSVGDQLADIAPAEPSRQTISHLKRSSPKEPIPRLVANKSESKSSDDSAPSTRPVTPPSTHTSSAWGKSPLSFSLKESPARSAPDPEHLKAVWSQASGRPAGTTSNSLKGIADDLPSIPFTVQDMKSEDGETPPPTAPAPPPSRLSLQEVTRAFQQVPGAPAPVPSAASRPQSYAQTPLLSPGSTHVQRSNQPIAISLPPQHGVRPPFAPYSHSMVGHSPSPTLIYAPGIPSPVAHHRMAVNGPSPPIAHGMWLPTPPPPPSQPGSFMRAAGAPPAQMMYPSPGPGTSPGAPGQMMHRRMSVVSPGAVPLPSGPSMYHGHPMDMQGHMHAQSPHHAHAHPVGHPVPHMHVNHIFSPPQPGQTPAMYAVPVGAGRGGMVPRSGYEGMQQVPQLPPHNAGYQTVPPTSFVHPFHS